MVVILAVGQWEGQLACIGYRDRCAGIRSRRGRLCPGTNIELIF